MSKYFLNISKCLKIIGEFESSNPPPLFEVMGQKFNLSPKYIQSLVKENRKILKICCQREMKSALTLLECFEIIKSYEFETGPVSKLELGHKFGVPMTQIHSIVENQMYIVTAYERECKKEKENGNRQLSGIDCLIVVHENNYKHPKPAISSLATKYHLDCGDIQRILVEHVAWVATLKKRKERQLFNRKEEQIKFLGMVMYEYLRRTMYLEVEVDMSVFQLKAAEVIESIALPNFTASYLWLFLFKKLYGIDDFDLESLKASIPPMTEEKPPQSLKTKDLVEFVMLRNSEIFKTDYDAGKLKDFNNLMGTKSYYNGPQPRIKVELENADMSDTNCRESEPSSSATVAVQKMVSTDDYFLGNNDGAEKSAMQEEDDLETDDEIVVIIKTESETGFDESQRAEISAMPEEDDLESDIEIGVTVKTESEITFEDNQRAKLSSTHEEENLGIGDKVIAIKTESKTMVKENHWKEIPDQSITIKTEPRNFKDESMECNADRVFSNEIDSDEMEFQNISGTAIKTETNFLENNKTQEHKKNKFICRIRSKTFVEEKRREEIVHLYQQNPSWSVARLLKEVNMPMNTVYRIIKQYRETNSIGKKRKF